MIWLLDAGHGGVLVDKPMTRGKRSPVIGFQRGVYEGEFNRDIMMRIMWLGAAQGLTIFPIVGGVTDFAIKERNEVTEFYMREHPDNCALISLHANAAGNGGWHGATGFKIFYRRDNSRKLAVLMREGLRKVYGGTIRDRGITKSAMKILKPKVPFGVLIEAPFMTNKDDAKLLASDDFRNQHTEGIVLGMHAMEAAGKAVVKR